MSDAPSWLQEDTVQEKQTKENPVKAAAKSTSKPSVDKTASKKSPTPPPPPPSSVPASSSQDIESQSIRSSTASADAANEFHIEEATLKSMQMWHLALRICYMIAAVLMATAAALSFQQQGDIGLAFFAIYVLFFSALICCFEVALSVR